MIFAKKQSQPSHADRTKQFVAAVHSAINTYNISGADAATELESLAKNLRMAHALSAPLDSKFDPVPKIWSGNLPPHRPTIKERLRQFAASQRDPDGTQPSADLVGLIRGHTAA